ncbi:universal stress protein [Croceibacterium ferulae]|uniref:universal stress protein n=1 Tax=Croceibacterium ferulae TaxID=1854641 RepID=UPI00138FB46B|nr:universal stress protein [Croceibacterium ferulae]
MIPIWKDVAVFLDSTPEGVAIGRHAAALARRHEAHLVGIYGLSHSEVHREETYARGPAALRSVYARMRNADAVKSTAAARAFAQMSDEFGISSEFRLVWRNDQSDDGALKALHCDLIVAAHPRPDDLPHNWSAERLLLVTGTPVLLVPSQWSGATIGTTVLVAWNRSREARRAVNDAMPFITTAERVVILTVDSDRDPARFGSEPGTHLAEHLARHDAHAQIVEVSSEGTTVAAAILAEAAHQNADLLVIGAYSHPRTAEILFGGVTRSLLGETHLPMLISR